MANAPVVTIGITFRDRDGNRAKLTCYAPWSFAVADLWTLAESLAARMQAISDALLCKIELLWRFKPDEIGEAFETSNVERKLLLLIQNENDEINAIIFPSVLTVLFETSGVYAGIRADLALPAFTIFQALLEAHNFRTVDNRPLGTAIAAGGLSL